MSKKKGKTPQPAAKKMTASAPKMEAFTFGEPVAYFHERRSLNNFHRDRVITFEQIAE
ncbi:hypothetical protein SND40_06285 [Escherichia coli]|nr:hypothetical protein [Escherichia coli]MCF6573277.1 hypothetical protein [Escherichia coli]MDD8497363.1 hypothetical protein [Escherichia coli]MDD8502363.1 hypothetical protein [Escherichia coli]MDD9083108.1 hypothetical protein [Escherichia coli]MDD9106522.1 hypothetical protein [Escherichia coli]